MTLRCSLHLAETLTFPTVNKNFQEDTPGDLTEEVERQWPVSAPWEPFVDKQEVCAWY